MGPQLCRVDSYRLVRRCLMQVKPFPLTCLQVFSVTIVSQENSHSSLKTLAIISLQASLVCFHHSLYFSLTLGLGWCLCPALSPLTWRILGGWAGVGTEGTLGLFIE